MADTIDDVAAEAAGQAPVEPAIDEQGVAEQLVAQAREKGIELVGPNGLLSQGAHDRQETAAPVDRGRSDRAVAISAGLDDRGDLGAFRRGVRRLSVAGDGLQDHRPGIGGDERLDEPATR